VGAVVEVKIDERVFVEMPLVELGHDVANIAVEPRDQCRLELLPAQASLCPCKSPGPAPRRGAIHCWHAER